MIKKFTIYGERNSGTNYLKALILKNFDVSMTWQYGWKHFFGFNDLSDSDDTLFIGITRNPYDWINSMYRNPHHLRDLKHQTIDNFLSQEVRSFNELEWMYDYEMIALKHIYNKTTHKPEFMERINDWNIYTHKRYRNIFELRKIKNDFLINKMPKLVKNYILIRHEDLLYHFNRTMNKIKEMGVPITSHITFPENIQHYFEGPYTNKHRVFTNKPKQEIIHRSQITKHLDLIQEIKIFPEYIKKKR